LQGLQTIKRSKIDKWSKSAYLDCFCSSFIQWSNIFSKYIQAKCFYNISLLMLAYSLLYSFASLLAQISWTYQNRRRRVSITSCCTLVTKQIFESYSKSKTSIFHPPANLLPLSLYSLPNHSLKWPNLLVINDPFDCAFESPSNYNSLTPQSLSSFLSNNPGTKPFLLFPADPKTSITFFTVSMHNDYSDKHRSCGGLFSIHIKWSYIRVLSSTWQYIYMGPNIP